MKVIKRLFIKVKVFYEFEVIFLGRVLKDEDTFEGLKVQTGECLHLVVKKKAPGTNY